MRFKDKMNAKHIETENKENSKTQEEVKDIDNRKTKNHKEEKKNGIHDKSVFDSTKETKEEFRLRMQRKKGNLFNVSTKYFI